MVTAQKLPLQMASIDNEVAFREWYQQTVLEAQEEDRKMAAANAIKHRENAIADVLDKKLTIIEDRNVTEDMTHENTAAYHFKERETIVQESSRKVVRVKVVPRSLSEFRRLLWKADQNLDWEQFKQLLYHNADFTYDEVVRSFVYSKIAADLVGTWRLPECSTLFCDTGIWTHLCKPEMCSGKKKKYDDTTRLNNMRDLFTREAQHMALWNVFELIGVELLTVLNDHTPTSLSNLRVCPREWHQQFFIDVLCTFRTIKMEFSHIWPVRTDRGVNFDPDLSPEYLKFFKVIAKNLTSSTFFDRETAITSTEEFRQKVRDMLDYEMERLHDKVQPYKDAEFSALTRKRLEFAFFRNEIEEYLNKKLAVYEEHFKGERNVTLVDLEKEFFPLFDRKLQAILEGDYAKNRLIKFK
jgi:hypothetical protein